MDDMDDNGEVEFCEYGATGKPIRDCIRYKKLQAANKAYAEEIAKLKAKPEATEFTKETSVQLKTWKDFRHSDIVNKLGEACDIIDSQQEEIEQRRKLLIEVLEAISQASTDCIFCSASSCPVNGEKRGWEEVKAEDAEEYHIDHDDNCIVTKIEQALKPEKQPEPTPPKGSTIWEHLH